MKGDFSRNTFAAKKHFSRVLLQQGRVQLDADWNEQAAILLHYVQTLASDLLGPHAGPGDGFRIVDVDANGDPLKNDFAVLAGRYYVNGILCENESRIDSAGMPIPVTYFSQPDHILDQTNDELPQGQSLVYLDVWERYISYLADDDIREKALGGPDTAGRAKTVWQVKILQPKVNGVAVPVTCDQISMLHRESSPTLRARVRPEQQASDPCIVAPASAYRGAENRLYRVEIHTGSDAGIPSFKWSRDNGSVAAAWLQGDNVAVSRTRGFEARQWVELTDDIHELEGIPGTLVQITNVDGDALQLNSPPPWNKDYRRPVVRRWDQMATDIVALGADNAIPILINGEDQGWFDLEDGVQIQFQSFAANKKLDYRTGDYWLIPARTATGAIEWPFEVDSHGQTVLDQAGPIPAALPPHGIKHDYAPLAIITVTGDNVVVTKECRLQIK